MPTRSENIKLGIFIAAVVALLAATIVLVGGQRFWRERDTYWVVSRESITGIDVSSPVTLHGVAVGEVAEVSLDPTDFGQVWLELEVDPTVELPASVRAYFRTTGLTGQRVIDLTDGSTAEGRLVPGSVIPRAETTLEQLEDRATVIARNAEAITERTDELLQRLQSIARAVETERIVGIVDDAEELMATLVSAGNTLETTIDRSRKGVEKVVSDVETVSEQTSAVLKRADTAAAEASEILRRVDTLVRVNEDDVRATIKNLRQTSQETRQLVRQLRRRPSLLLRGSERPKARELP